ncbi:glucokinase [Desulfitobacterium sp. THU1]|uniref:glucokinase n=1 Tax=Desulfitobacterium sp. THU1 TaxID=3138072 RepID=UPI00311DA11E
MPYEKIVKGYPLYLAGDIGGTKTLLGLYSLKGTALSLVRERKLSSREWDDLTPLIQGFLDEMTLTPEDITGGCLSLAGPITEETCLLTNLNRIIHFQSLLSTLNFQRPLLFVNDLEAMGQGLMVLENEDLLCLNPSVFNSSSNSSPTPTSTSAPTSTSKSISPSSLNRALIAPGTGLGQAMILGDHQIYATEGAHRDYAPRTEQEIRLLRFLTQKYDHISYERILSGPGLANIYHFLRWEAHPHSLRDPLPTPEQITKRALAGICPLCTETLELFIKILGAEAGNLALMTLAYGGIYLGGGIPPKILPKLQEGGFMEAFLAKGRFRDLLSTIPIYVILNERAPLLGAAYLAATAEYPKN